MENGTDMVKEMITTTEVVPNAFGGTDVVQTLDLPPVQEGSKTALKVAGGIAAGLIGGAGITVALIALGKKFGKRKAGKNRSNDGYRRDRYVDVEDFEYEDDVDDQEEDPDSRKNP